MRRFNPPLRLLASQATRAHTSPVAMTLAKSAGASSAAMTDRQQCSSYRSAFQQPQRRTLASSPGVNGKARDTPPHPTAALTALECVNVYHGSAYKAAMKSRHGKQLALAEEEGRGRDDAPFDPFSIFASDEAEETAAASAASEDGDAQDVEGSDEEEEEEESPLGDLESPLDDEDVLAAFENYNADGSVIRPRSEIAALRAGAPAGGKFAVIHLAGIQHKVSPDDLLVVNKLRPVADWAVGSVHTVKDEDVLLMGSSERTWVGLPGVKGGEIDVMVEEITRDATVVVFKKRRRKNSKRKNGFRREVTFLRVLDIRIPDEVEGAVGDEEGEGEPIAA